MPHRIAVDQKVCGWTGGHRVLIVWNLINFTIIENAHEVESEFSFFIMWRFYGMYNYQRKRKDSGLCRPLWAIRLKCQWMTKLETKHIFQAQVCDCILSEKNATGNWWCIIKSNRTVLKFGSEIQLDVHNYLQCWRNWTQPKTPVLLKSPLKTIKPTKNSPLYFSIGKCTIRLHS